MIILDFETNSSNISDVIEVAAVRIDKNFNILDKFHRYYLSRYPVNYYSYAVHRLTPELILDYRKDKSYSSYFAQDDDFFEFCRGKIGKSKRYLTKEMTGGKYDNSWKLVVPNDICGMKNGVLDDSI